MAAIRLAWLLPAKALRPVAISYNTAPNAKISERASASLPSNCSGAMYWSVPSSVPSEVSGVVWVAQGGWHRGFRRIVPLRQPEVQQFHAGLGQHDVAGLQVAMNHSLPVRLLDRIRDIDGTMEHSIEREWTLGQAFGERFALKIFQHQEIDSILMPDIVQRTNVRVIQRRNGTCFAFKPLT